MEWNGATNTQIVIIICSIVVALFLVLILISNYFTGHPCLEYKTYCYYKAWNVGAGPTFGGDGGVGISVVPSIQKIYVDCNNNEFIRGDIYQEEQCLIRK